MLAARSCLRCPNGCSVATAASRGTLRFNVRSRSMGGFCTNAPPEVTLRGGAFALSLLVTRAEREIHGWKDRCPNELISVVKRADSVATTRHKAGTTKASFISSHICWIDTFLYSKELNHRYILQHFPERYRRQCAKQKDTVA